MVRIYYRKLRSRRLYANARAFRDEINRTFHREVGPTISTALLKRVANWDMPPEMKVEYSMDEGGIGVYTRPIGWGARYWRWVSFGVRGHPIYPRPGRKSVNPGHAPALAIYSYSPKTTPGGGYGAPSYRAFAGYRPYVARWPGVRARNFEGHVEAELRTWFRRTMESAMRRAVKAAMREAT